MRTYSNLFILGVLIILFTASCGSDTPNTITIDNPSSTRAGGNSESVQVNFNGKMVTISTADIVGTAQQFNAEDADAQAIMNINQSLMGAEKQAQLLDVNFTMADEPVENGMFVFGIETADAKNLTLEMFDEEGYSMVANNKFEITEGNNYKALNVKSLENGTYNFRLKDDSGKELTRQVKVAAAE